MTWGGEWTPEKVLERLVQAFRDLPGAPVYSPTLNVFVRMPGEAVANMDLIASSSLILGRDSLDRIVLLTWARSRAGFGSSVSEWCRLHPMQRSSFYDHRDRAARRLARHLGSGAEPVLSVAA